MPPPRHFGPPGFCVGSNAMCRQACLVFAGHNWSVFYNAKLKTAKTLALIHEPVAFCRALFEACQKVARSKAARRFIRLNVLSDIPWELVAPWIFDEVRDVSFYDYTKVAGRRPPANYDLTFSFSGTNEKLCRRELSAGRRVAAVFIGMRRVERGGRRGEWEAIGGAGEKLVSKVPLPATFWGRKVVDGDISDLRSLDPGGVIVGLRFKVPHGQEVDPTAREFSFVTPAFVVSERCSTLVRMNPGGGGDEIEYLVAAQTPSKLNVPQAGPDAEGAAMLDAMVEYGVDVKVDPRGQVGA